MKLAIKKINIIIWICLFAICFAGCGNNSKTPSDGEYEVNITTEGGTGKATITSPAKLTVINGEASVVLVWTSKNYDYMIVDEVTYYNENPGGESTFTIPVKDLSKPLKVIGDTTAMSTPHEIEYTLTFEIGKALGKISFEDLEHTGSINLQYATKFSIDEYGEYKLLTIADSGRFLLIPEKKMVPDNIPKDVVVLKQPLDNTYLTSSSAIDLISKIEALDNITLSAIKQSDWYVDAAIAAMESGKMQYAGKYSAPDYELITSKQCNFAILNTMIFHKPEVKEKLEELGIPAIIEYSSYEDHPFGRLEWIKLYGVLFNKQKEAEDYFNSQLELLEPILEKDNTGKSVAFFSINSSGMINVRKPHDYISQMIRIAGGNYALDEALVEEENDLSTMNIQMEDFFVAAKDADIIIYNSTIEGEIKSIDELLEKNSLLAELKAVKEGKVYCTTKNFFQQTTGMAEFINDLNSILLENDKEYSYLTKIK